MTSTNQRYLDRGANDLRETGLRRTVQRNSPLNGNLPEIFVKRQENVRLPFPRIAGVPCLSIQDNRFGPSSPDARHAKLVYESLREVLVGQGAHLRWDRKGRGFVGQVAGIRKARENVLECQPWVLCKQILFGLTSREEFENKPNRKASPSDHRLTRKSLRINGDPL